MTSSPKQRYLTSYVNDPAFIKSEGLWYALSNYHIAQYCIAEPCRMLKNLRTSLNFAEICTCVFGISGKSIAWLCSVNGRLNHTVEMALL